MPKTSYLLGGAALVGGAVYLYQDRVSSVSHRYPSSYQSNQQVIDQNAERTGARIGSKIDNLASNVKDTYEDKRSQFDREINLRASQLENKRSELAGWTSDKAAKVQNLTDAHADKHKEQADALYNEVHKNDPRGLKKLKSDVSGKYYETKDGLVNSVEDSANSGKNFFLRAGDKYIEAVNSVAVGTENKIKGVKNSIVGGVDDTKHAVEEDYDSAKSKLGFGRDGWDKGLTREQELNRRTERSLHGWGDTAAGLATEYKEDPAPTTNNSGLFSNWGKDPKDRAIESYNKAKTDLARAKEDAKQYQKSWFSWGADKKSEASERANYRLNQAQRQLEATQKDLSQYGADLVNKVNKDYVEPLKNEASKQADQARSWGLSKKKDLDSHTENAKNAASEKYKQAKANLDEATENAKQYQKSWLNWSGDKKDDAADLAKSKLKDAQKSYEDATTSLSQYGSDLIDKANKDILNPIKNSAQQTYDDAKSWGSKKYDEVADESGKTKDKLFGYRSDADIKDEEIARNARNAIKGFSSSADTFAQEELAEVHHQNAAKKGAVINWGEGKYNQSKEGAQYAYDQAQESLKNAQTEANKYKKSFFNWSSNKGDEAAQVANENLAKAQEIASQTGSNLNNWLVKGSDHAIQATKSGLDTVNDYTQSGLDKASSYVRSNH